MLRNILRFTFIVMVVVDTSAETVQPKVQPGQYVLDRDSGKLTISAGERKKLNFEIETIGGNCHSCEVSGVILGEVGHADDEAADGSDSACEISFTADHSAVVVRPITEEKCRFYCGMRASFDGTYRIPPAACTSAGRQILRDQSLRLYRSRRFSQAADTLQSLITQCEKFMGWIEIDKVRNDLALAQYHNGDSQQCLTTLNTTLASKVNNEEELKAGVGVVYLPPCDFDNYIGVAKSTWFNKALCSKAASTKQ